jgi:hypothetical protein
MSRETKESFKEYFKNNETNYSSETNNFFDTCKSSANNTIQENETYKSITRDLDFYYDMLKSSLTTEQIQLLFEIEEISTQQNSISNDICFMEGFKFGYLIKSIISQEKLQKGDELK